MALIYKFQTGGTNLWNTNKAAFVDSTLGANKNLDFVKRLYEKNTKSIMVPGQKHPSTHLMNSSDNLVYPSIVNENGKLSYKNDDNNWEAADYAVKNKEYIKFKTPEQANWFASNYKVGTNVLKSR